MSHPSSSLIVARRFAFQFTAVRIGGPVALLSLMLAASGFAQSDAGLFAQGRVAFDSYKDCTAAEKAFSAVSSEGQNSALWLSYMARTEECLGKLRNAISFYEHYDKLMPGQIEIINKLGELRYRSTQFGIHFSNECSETALIVVTYFGVDGRWTTKGWWRLQPNQQVVPVRSPNRNFYFYGTYGDKHWSGEAEKDQVDEYVTSQPFTRHDDDPMGPGYRKVSMRKKVVANGSTEVEVTLVCN